jgi:hypothetical protein
MKVKYSYKDGRCEAAISDNADWQLFNGVVDAILRNFKGTVLERVDGLDERYWDIEIGTEIVTLHLQHYLGIVLFSQDQGTNDLIREIGRYLEIIEPKKIFRECSTQRISLECVGA